MTVTHTPLHSGHTTWCKLHFATALHTHTGTHTIPVPPHLFLHETRQPGRTKLYPVTAAPPRIQSYPIGRPKSSLQTAAPVSGTRLHFLLLLLLLLLKGSSYYYCTILLPAADHGSPDTLLSPKVEAFPLTTSQIRQVLLLKQPLEMGGDPTWPWPKGSV